MLEEKKIRGSNVKVKIEIKKKISILIAKTKRKA